MSDGYQYILEMVDRLSGPAKTAKQQVEALTAGLSEETKELQKLEKQYERLNAAESVDIALSRKMQAQIEAKKSSISGLGDKIRSSVAGQNDLAAKTKKTADELRSASGEAGGFGQTIKSLGPYAAAAAAALLVLGGAIVGLLYGGAKLALDAALFKAQTTAALKSVTGTSAAARSTFLDIRKISDELGITEAKAQALGLSLLDAGVSQNDLGDAIKSIALLEKVRGEQAAGKLQELIKKSAAAGTFKLEGESLVGTGLSQIDVIEQLAKKLGKSNAEVEAQLKAGKIKASDGIAAINAALNSKLGDAKGLTSFGDAIGKAYEAFTRLFEDVNTGPLIEAVKEVAGWFDKSTVAGDALHYLFTTIFDGLFAAAKEVLPYLKVGFLEIVIVALKIYIALKPVLAQLSDLWTAMTGASAEASILGQFLIGAVDVLGFILTSALAQFSVLLAFIQGTIVFFQELYAVAESVFEAITGAIAFVGEALAEIFGPGAGSSIGSALIQGLIGGITGGSAGVVSSLLGVGQAAIGAVKGVLGIASPSRVMRELGGHTVEGFSQGVEAGTADTQGALSSAVAPPAPAAAAGGGGVIHVTVAPGAIVLSGVGGNLAELQEMLESKLQEMLEGILIQLGGASGASEVA